MADIDMQRLDWKQALRVFEQIRTLRPDDDGVRRNLVDLNLRLGQQAQAMAEMEGFINYLQSNGQSVKIMEFLKGLVQEHQDEPLLQRALAEELHRAGRTEDAVALLDRLGESLLTGGKVQEAAEVIQQIILMNPAGVADYRKLLMQLQAGEL
jgi:predicted Zn-dependent protease